MDDMTYIVVKNAENQHALWIGSRPVPDGWEPAGMTGDKDACLAFVRTAWTDITPLSVQRTMR